MYRVKMDTSVQVKGSSVKNVLSIVIAMMVRLNVKLMMKF